MSTRALLAHRPAVHPGPEGELRQGRHQRRELGRVRQRPAVRQGVPRGELQERPRGRAGRSAAARAAAAGWSTSATTSRTTSAATRSSRSDDEKAWKALINLCKVLNQTPADKLEEALKPILDIDGLLWFLALDVALINKRRLLDSRERLHLYLDEKGKFHVIPHDMNEAFRPGGRGGRRHDVPPADAGRSDPAAAAGHAAAHRRSEEAARGVAEGHG